MLSVSSTSAPFASFDTLLSQEVNRTAALAEENSHLRSQLSETPPVVADPEHDSMDAAQLQADLQAARLAQAEMALELRALKASQHRPTRPEEDSDSEISVLRQSLAALASELEAEKTRVDEVERKRRDEEAKVALLRAAVDESRRALLRYQGNSNAARRRSADAPLVRRASVNSMGLVPMVLGSGVDLIPRRKSSQALLCASGLGLVDSTPHRPAHHRGSASLHTPQEFRDEDDRLARLRDLRHGVQTTKIASRRGSNASVVSAGDIDLEGPPRRRLSSFGSSAHPIPTSLAPSFSGGSSPISRPPSAPLRVMGRKQSLAVFDSLASRRSSIESDYPADPAFSFLSSARSYSMGGSTQSPAQLIAELEDLRIALAESEEGRRATQVALNALKEFVGDDVRLPPLPTDADAAPARSRWSLPRLPSLSRRDCGVASRVSSGVSTTAPSPNLTTYTPRRSSNSFMSVSAATATATAAGAVPSFGTFSFAAKTAPKSDDESTSPTMRSPHSFSDVPGLESTSASESESSRASSPEGISPTFDVVHIYGTEDPLEMGPLSSPFIEGKSPKRVDTESPRASGLLA